MEAKHRQTIRKRLQCSGVSKVLVVGNAVVVFSLATALRHFCCWYSSRQRSGACSADAFAGSGAREHKVFWIGTPRLFVVQPVPGRVYRSSAFPKVA